MAEYVRLKGYKERNDLARLYRKIRRVRPDLARLLWRREKAAYKIFKERFERMYLDG